MPMRAAEVRRRFRMKWKYWLSFLRKDWQLSDYPVRVRPFATQPDPPGSRWHTPRYEAMIEGWHLFGLGDTKEEARSQLAAAFARAKAGPSLIPRPGVLVPFDFASTERIDAHGALVDDFLDRVFGIKAAWVSDLSGIWEFCIGEPEQIYLDKIREIYGVDCSDLAHAPLVDILDRIAARRNSGSGSGEAFDIRL
ncbi:MAG: hypothetical protein WCA44_12830 [Acidobacteriaceae bacterium]